MSHKLRLSKDIKTFFFYCRPHILGLKRIEFLFYLCWELSFHFANSCV